MFSPAHRRRPARGRCRRSREPVPRPAARRPGRPGDVRPPLQARDDRARRGAPLPRRPRSPAPRGWPTSPAARRTWPTSAAWEATNLLTVAAALVAAAPLREETRGSHWRDDFPDRDDERLGPPRRRHAGRRRAAARADPAAVPDRSRGVSSFTDLPSALATSWRVAGLDPRRVHDDVAAAVAEDLPGEDVTSAATLDPTQVAWADLVARAPRRGRRAAGRRGWCSTTSSVPPWRSSRAQPTATGCSAATCCCRSTVR